MRINLPAPLEDYDRSNEAATRREIEHTFATILPAAPATGGGGAVTSVFTRTGAVLPVVGDYAVGDVTGAAPLASPTLTGTPIAPTASALTNTTQLATTAYADAAVAVEASRAATAEALKAPLASPALTGTPTVPTASALTNTTQAASTAYADAAVAVEAAARAVAITAADQPVPVQTALGRSTWSYATVNTYLGFGNPAAPGVNGTSTWVTPTFSSTLAMSATQFVSTAAAGAGAGYADTRAIYIRGNVAGRGGYSVSCIFRPAVMPASNTRLFAGLSSSLSLVATADPSTRTSQHIVGFSKDAADTNWQMCTCNGTTFTKVDTTVAPDATSYYKVDIVALGNSSTISVTLTNLSTGVVVYSNVAVSTTLPSATTYQGLHMEIGTATTSAATIYLVSTNGWAGV